MKFNLSERDGMEERCGEMSSVSGVVPTSEAGMNETIASANSSRDGGESWSDLGRGATADGAVAASRSDSIAANTYLGATSNIRVAATMSPFESGSPVELSLSESLGLSARSVVMVAFQWSPFVWLAGVPVTLVPLVGGVVSLARLTRTSQPLPSDLAAELKALARSLGIQRPIVAMLSESRGIPMRRTGRLASIE